MSQIERNRNFRKFNAAIGAIRLTVLQDAARYLLTQIGHHCDAAAVAAGAEMQSVFLAQVRKGVQCHGDEIGPGMRDANILQLRPTIGHHLEQQSCADIRMNVFETGTTAIYDTSVTA